MSVARLLSAEIIDCSLPFFAFGVFVLVFLAANNELSLWWSLGSLDVLAVFMNRHWNEGLLGLLLAWLGWVIANFIGVRFLSKTLGQHLMQLTTSRLSGNAPTLSQCTLRCVSSTLSLLFFGAGIFWVLVDEVPQTWHDLLADTQVVLQRRSVRGGTPDLESVQKTVRTAHVQLIAH